MLEEARLRAFAAMAGGVVHDFNNTLMTIAGYSGLLMREPEILDDRAETQRTLEIIHTAATDAGHVVDRLREFYHARDAHEQTENLDFNAIVEEAVEFTQPKWHGLALAEGRRIDFDFDFSPITAIEGRKSELREILVNLIFNAVDAMPKGGTITCGTRCRGPHLVFEMTDTGVGMAPEVLERCTSAFFTTKGESGTGLGLAMVSNIVHRHGGLMEIQSEPGAGTLVRIAFPIAQVHEESQPVVAAPEKAEALKIMVVDDDPHMRNVVSRLLAKAGHSVTQVSSGLEALAQTEQSRFDLLLTDHAMPGMTGIELAALMRGVDPNQRVILFTGYPLSPKETPSDISCLLKKPAQPDELQLAIATAMAR
jgi:CheY-like chemotaxis protein